MTAAAGAEKEKQDADHDNGGRILFHIRLFSCQLSGSDNQSMMSKPVYLRRHSGTTMPAGV